MGLFVARRAVWLAFLRGRQTRNLYRLGCSDARLTQTVGELRRALWLHRPVRQASWKDRLSFAGWAAVSLLWTLTSAPFALPLFPLLGVTLSAFARLTERVASTANQ